MQYNIFQNDFYDDAPGLPWAYRLTVLLGDPPMPVEILEKSVKDVKLPDMELKTVRAFFRGKTFLIPTRYSNTGTFSITFNDDKNLSVYNKLLRIFRRSYDNRYEIQQTADGIDYIPKYSDMSASLTIQLEILDPTIMSKIDTQLNVLNELETNSPEVVAVYTFGDCFFETIDEVEFDYSSEECVEWSIPVVYNSIANDYPGKSEAEVFDRADDSKNDLSIPANSSTNNTKWDGIPKRAVRENMYSSGGSVSGDGSSTEGNGTGYGSSSARNGSNSGSSESTYDTTPQNGIKTSEPDKNADIDDPRGTLKATKKRNSSSTGDGSGDGDGSGSSRGAGSSSSSGNGIGENSDEYGASQEEYEAAFMLIAQKANKKKGADPQAAQQLTTLYNKYRWGEMNDVQATAFENSIDLNSIRSSSSMSIEPY